MARNYVDFVTKRYLIAGLAALKRNRGTVPRIRRPKVMIKASAFPWLAGLAAVTSVTMAQDPIPIDGPEPTFIHGRRFWPRRVRNAGPGLPTWQYQVASPVNGASYRGYMVGTDPSVGATRPPSR